MEQDGREQQVEIVDEPEEIKNLDNQDIVGEVSSSTPIISTPIISTPVISTPITTTPIDQVQNGENVESEAKSEFDGGDNQPSDGAIDSEEIKPAVNKLFAGLPSDIDGNIGSSETKKVSLTPQLGSDFMDFSDDEESVHKPRQGGGFFGKNDSSDDVKAPTTLEEYNKNIKAEVAEEKKSKKDEKKKEKGFMKFFRRGRKKTDDEPVKQMSSSAPSSPATFSSNVKPAYIPQPNRPPQPTDQQTFMGPTANPQQRPPIQGQGPIPVQMQGPEQSQTQVLPPQNIQPMYGRPPLQPNQQPGYRQGPERPQLGSQKSRPAQSQPQNMRPSSPIQVEEYTQSENSVPTTPATPATPSNSMYNVLRIFIGQNIQSNVDFKVVLLSQTTTAASLIKQALNRFKLDNEDNWDDYFITIKEVDGGLCFIEYSSKSYQSLINKFYVY